MNGMELSRLFWNTYKDELFAGDLAPYAARAAAGLVGEGSECWGYDDETSRDHDWGPGCCIWLTRDDYAAIGAELTRRYQACAARPLAGFPPRQDPTGSMATQRVGVFRVEAFYVRFLPEGMPKTLEAWRQAREFALAAATNGEVFCDGAGRFTEIRERILDGYPRDLQLHRIAAGCVHAAQDGQYNFARQAARGEDLAALSALARFQDDVLQIAFALAGRFRPFYKWAPRELLTLGALGSDLHDLLERSLTAYRLDDIDRAARAIEETAERIVEELNAQGLSQGRDSWLLAHADAVNAKIEDEGLRRADLMA